MIFKTPSRKQIKSALSEHSLTLFGISALGPQVRFNNFKKWLQHGNHASMKFLERYLEKREDPRKILEGATRAIVVGLPYYHENSSNQSKNASYRIAKYAHLADYHKIIKKRAKEFITQIDPMQHHKHLVTVDTAPVLERALAEQCSEGFIGKNTLFIHPTMGSFFLLGEVFTTMELEADIPSKVDPNKRSRFGGCGTCKRCQVHCPTGALDKDYSIDARKCLAYYTIEHRGLIPVEIWPKLSSYLFGCDICQLVCPYNRQTQPIPIEKLKLKQLPDASRIVTMSQQQYQEWFGGTPVTRAKIDGLRRNALIIMVVNQHPDLDSTLSWIHNSPSPQLLKDTAAQIEDYNRLTQS